jgi:hypothetical protein
MKYSPLKFTNLERRPISEENSRYLFRARLAAEKLSATDTTTGRTASAKLAASTAPVMVDNWKLVGLKELGRENVDLGTGL